MKHTRKSYADSIFNMRVLAGFVAICLASAMLFAASYWQSASVIQTERSIDTIYESIGELRLVVAQLKDAERNADYYVVSGKQTFLKAYNRAADSVPACVKRLKLLFLMRREVPSQLEAFDANVGLYLEELRNVVAARSDKDAHTTHAARMALALTLDDIDAQVADLESSQIASLKGHMSRSASTSEYLNQLFLSLGLVMLLLFLVLVGWILNYVNERERHAGYVDWLNDELRSYVGKLEDLNRKLGVANVQALESSKLKSEFLANISHELRTPLCAILGYSEILACDYADDENSDIANRIYHSAQEYLRLIDDLIVFSSLDAGTVSLRNVRFSARSLIDRLYCSTLPAAMAKNLTLNSVVGSDIPEVVVGDADRIYQVLLRLADNATKFTEKGEVTISVKVVTEKDDTVTLSFAVSDTGIGITGDANETIFEPFVQADGSNTRKYGGIGLGLSLCKRLAELMNGKIAVCSNRDSGSTFTFTVPLHIGTGTVSVLAR